MEAEGTALPAAPPPTAWLVAPDGQTRALAGDVLTCGRSAENDLVLGDLSVSRRHARFERRPEGYALTDLGSANGTYVNGQFLAPSTPRLLRDGDQLALGDNVLTLRLPARPAPAAARPATGQPIEQGTARLFETAVEIVERGPAIYARIDARGTLNGETIQPLLDACQWAADRKVTRVVIDTARLDYLDSAGIGGLVRLQRYLSELGGGLVLANPRAEVRQLLELVNLSSFLPMYPDEGRAASAACALAN